VTSALRVRTARAVKDDRLGANLANATDTFAARKAAAFAQLVDVDGAREAARAVKARVLANLPDVLEKLADNFMARGGHVHWARTPDEANAYVTEVVQRTEGRRVVKSKSMATEEIGLNQALESAGCHVVETDLGEWILQVGREHPSHIIVPAIHKNRRQIAEVLGRVEGGELSDVPEDLAAFARHHLRAEFLRADVGISGVNFGVAETGSLVLVTNEGNGRLVTSVPPVHIAIMGLERVVQTWEELELMLSLLPRAATGQAITTYVSVITGPRRSPEVDGPDELHLVILDNGRSEILGTEFSEMLACIRCGACLNACPVYRQVGGHAYDSVYPGPMGAVLTPLLASSGPSAELANASSLCGACWQACPVGIPLQDMLLALRRRTAAAAGRTERAAWGAWAAAWSRPAGYRASLRAAAGGLRLTGSPDHLPGHVDRWSVGRSLPTPPAATFRQLWDRGEV
jgi:L-lactate dehydrogenase complex protein LldF